MTERKEFRQTLSDLVTRDSPEAGLSRKYVGEIHRLLESPCSVAAFRDDKEKYLERVYDITPDLAHDVHTINRPTVWLDEIESIIRQYRDKSDWDARDFESMLLSIAAISVDGAVWIKRAILMQDFTERKATIH